MKPQIKKLMIGLIVLALLSPLGLFLPNKLKALEGAWGEWGPEEIAERVGFVPAGFQRLADIWKAPIADYTRATETSPFTTHALWYILSAFMGIVFTVLVIYGLTRVLTRSF